MQQVTLKRVENKYEKNEDIKNLIRYIVRDKKNDGLINLWGTRGTLSDVEKAYEQIVGIQKFIGKEKGRRIHHLIVSFPEEIKDEQVVYEIAEALADHLGKEYQLLYGIHTDTDNLHIHFAVSAVSYKDGKKWHKDLKEFDTWRKQLLKIVNKYLGKKGC